jgi:hypothetical protein
MNTNSHTNTSSLSAGICNNSNTQSYSQTYTNNNNNNSNNNNNGSPPTTTTPSPPIKEKGPCLSLPLTSSSEQPSYDLRHPLKDPQFGRATPFPVTTYMDTDSGYGGDDADDDCTRSINWGSVLSLSSQSALDPLNNNDLFSTSATTGTTTTGSPTCPPTSNLRTIPLSSSNDSVSHNNGNTSDSNTQPIATSLSNGIANGKEATSTSVDLITLKSSNSPSATLTTLLTTATTSISITPTSLTSPTSVSSLTPTHWNFDYLDMDLGGTTHEIYDILPNCYKFTTFTTEDFVKSTIMEPTKVVGECDTLDTFTTHIMVGS